MEYIDTVNRAQARLVKEFSADHFKYEADGILVYKDGKLIGKLRETIPPKYVRYVPEEGYELDKELKPTYSGCKNFFD